MESLQLLLLGCVISASILLYSILTVTFNRADSEVMCCPMLHVFQNVYVFVKIIMRTMQ